MIGKYQDLQGKLNKRNALKSAIQMTRKLSGEKLFQEIKKTIGSLSFSFEDMKEFFITPQQAKKSSYSIQVVLPQQNCGQNTIKRAIMASLMFPAEYLYPKSDVNYVMRYYNVPFQIIVSALFGYQKAFQKLRAYLFFSDLGNQHEFRQIIQKLESNITKGKTYYIARESIDCLFKQEKFYFDTIVDPDTPFNHFVEIYEQFKSQVDKIY